MRSACGEQESIVFGELDHVVAQLANVLLGLLDVLANASSHFYDRLVHLRLDLLFHDSLALGDDLAVDVRTQISGLRIDCLIFLFNTDGE